MINIKFILVFTFGEGRAHSEFQLHAIFYYLCGCKYTGVKYVVPYMYCVLKTFHNRGIKEKKIC